MNIGVLWYDASNKPLEEKVRAAALYHTQRYGADANTCFVNPAAIKKNTLRVDKVTVRAAKFVLPNHFWVGVDNGG